MDSFWVVPILHSMRDMTFAFSRFNFAFCYIYISWSVNIRYLGYFFSVVILVTLVFILIFTPFNMTCTVTIVTALCREASLVSISQFYLSRHIVNTDHKKADWPLCLMKHHAMETYGEVEVWLHSCITSSPRQWSASLPFPLIPSGKSSRFP